MVFGFRLVWVCEATGPGLGAMEVRYPPTSGHILLVSHSESSRQMAVKPTMFWVTRYPSIGPQKLMLVEHSCQALCEQQYFCSHEVMYTRRAGRGSRNLVRWNYWVQSQKVWNHDLKRIRRDRERQEPFVQVCCVSGEISMMHYSRLFIVSRCFKVFWLIP